MLRRIGRSFNSRHGFCGCPDFTKNNYKVQRGNYQTLDEHHIDFFRKILGESRMLMDLSDLEQYNVDWLKHLRGNSKLVLKPRTTEEVSQILSYCNENRLAVCPQGGNTGLVGGGVAVFDEIVISTSLMNQIESIDEISGILVCQSGCILEALENFLATKDLTVPLDLGAKGSCHIGGNVATNAGGLRMMRYGNLHGNVLGLEVVKANGEVLDCMSALKKDNTGYHLKNLFIGSEGTLGFITKVAIQCPVKPKAVNLSFLGLQSFAKVLDTYRRAKSDLGEILSAVEVIDAATMQFVKAKLNVDNPLGDYPFYMMIETAGSCAEHDENKLEKFLEIALVKHLALNGTIATEPSKVKKMWSFREKLPESFVKDSYVFIYDFTFPMADYYTLVEETREFMGAKAEKVFGFGHLGDGNLHLQIAVNEYGEQVHGLIDGYIFRRVKELGGSISAEHGIGFLKSKHLVDYKDAGALKFMRDLKMTLDPNSILNPYKTVF